METPTSIWPTRFEATGKYEAFEADEDDEYTYQVVSPDGKDYLGPNMTPAQAHIFAFALNAIRAGNTLAVVVDADFIMHPVDIYTGPTDGI